MIKGPSQKRKGPWRITFDTNPDLCNLRCIMCEQNSIYNNKTEIPKQNRLMDFRIIQKVIASAAKFGLMEIIPSTMGEPLLYPQFEKMIKLIEKYRLKLNLTTNGTFPKRGAEKWGELILPVTSDVKISINGATKETAESIMVGLNFDKQLSNISKLIELRDAFRANGTSSATITFQVTYMERNLAELAELLKIAIDLGVDRFKGHHLWLTWPELQEESLRRNEDSISRWNKTVKNLKEIANSYTLPNGKKIILDNLYELSKQNIGNSNPQSWICPFLGREAWIAWDGTFNVCCAPDNLRKSFGYFGNVTNSDFMKLWNDEKYNRLITNWGNSEVCKNCNMRRPLKDIKRC